MCRGLLFALSLSLAGVSLAVLSCSNPRPRSRAIPEERLVELYANVLVVREEGRVRGSDTLAVSKRTDSLCAAYGLTRVQLQTELGSERSDLAGWKEFYEKVIRRLEQLQREDRSRGS
jgi:hypothetical protein